MADTQPGKHPYYPRDLQLPGYQPMIMRFESVLAIAFGTFGAVFLSVWLLSGRAKYLQQSERIWMCWFALCGVIHLFVEGSVVADSKFYQDTTGNIFSEIWKEYSKADSRYASRDAFIIQMELITAYVEGPACFAIVWGILNHSAWRFTAMLLVSCGQLYGDLLYYLTCWHVGFEKHSRPEALYFWGYYVATNAVWIIVPLMCIVYTARNINSCVAASGGAAKRKKNA